jgi:hypothetical protein
LEKWFCGWSEKRKAKSEKRKAKRFNAEDAEVRGEEHREEHRLKPMLLLGGAADAGQDAEFAQDDHV